MKFKNVLWLIVLIILVPVWSVLVILAMVGDLARDIFDGAYGYIYKKAGKPFESKERGAK